MKPTGRLLGSGRVAEVYEHGEQVLKLYRATASKSAAFKEAAILATIEPLALPAPNVLDVGQYGGRWGLIMTRASGMSFADVMTFRPEQKRDHLREMVKLHKLIHEQPGIGLPGLKARLASNIRQVARLGSARQAGLLARLETMPDGDKLCHGDFHPWNIIGPPGQAVVVDWLDASQGIPAADVCRSYVLIRKADQEFATAYVEAYAASSGITFDNILVWLPFIAAARLAEGVPDEEDELMRLAGSA